MPRRFAMLAACGLVGGAFGFAMSSIPAPDDVSVFWIGNFCAPWLVLAFLAGRMQATVGLAALAGVITNVVCAAGFYARFLTLDPLRLGLPPETPLAEIAAISFERWLVYIAPWLLAALLGGSLYGALGGWLRKGRPVTMAIVLAAPFLAEPVLWPLRNGYYQGPWFVWAIEIGIGLAIALAILRTGHRSGGRRVPDLA